MQHEIEKSFDDRYTSALQRRKVEQELAAERRNSLEFKRQRALLQAKIEEYITNY